MTQFKVGDSLFFNDYGTNIIEGKVIDVMSLSGFDSRDVYCVKLSNQYKSLSSRDRIYRTDWEARLDVAQRLQTEASKLLEQAAELFKQSGVRQQKEEEQGEMK